MEDFGSLKHVCAKRYMAWKKCQRQEDNSQNGGEGFDAHRSFRKSADDSIDKGIITKLKNIFKNASDEK